MKARKHENEESRKRGNERCLIVMYRGVRTSGGGRYGVGNGRMSKKSKKRWKKKASEGKARVRICLQPGV